MAVGQHHVIDFVFDASKNALCVSLYLFCVSNFSYCISPELWDHASRLAPKIDEILLHVVHARFTKVLFQSFAHTSVHYVSGNVEEERCTVFIVQARAFLASLIRSAPFYRKRCAHRLLRWSSRSSCAALWVRVKPSKMMLRAVSLSSSRSAASRTPYMALRPSTASI